jgi:hypothetical protein
MLTCGAVRHALILPDHARRHLFLVAGPRGWTLPSVSLARDHPGAVDAVIRAVRRRYGIAVSVLRTFARPRDPRTGVHNAALELERLDVRPPRARGGRWVACGALGGIRLHRRDDREALARWRASPLGKAEWMRPGWRARAVRWAEGRIDARASRIIQLRAWEASTVLRLVTRKGTYYLKAVEPPCDHEPGLTRWLSRRFPRAIAPVVAVDRRGRWLLMRAAHGPTLRSRSRLSDWTRAAREYGRLQRATLGSPALPRVLHRRRRDLTWLAAQIDPLVRDAQSLAVGGRWRLTRAQRARLRRLAPTLRARCHALARYRIPLALDHGDLWGANVVVGARGPVILDWEDAVLAHPFWAVFMLPWSHGFWERWGHQGAAAARLGEAYLAGWAGRDGADRYRDAFRLSRALAPVHHAAIWWQDVLPYLDNSLETAALLPFFLRRALEANRRD